MSELTKKQRDDLDEADFADPARRLFPILDASDVRGAAALLGKAPENMREKIKARVKAIAKRKGFPIPDAWKDDADMSADAAFAAEAPADGARPDAAGDTVRRTAPVIFRINPDGDYTFARGAPFNLTPEDVLALCEDFRPVPLDDNHRPTHLADGSPAPASYFAGKLGKVVSLTPAADYSGFGGELEIPRWLHEMHAGEPLKLSARFDRESKRLRDVALTPNPRIGDAAAFAERMHAEFAQDQARRMVPPPPPEPPAGASAREQELEALLARERQERMAEAARRIASESVAFTASLADVIIPAERAAVMGLYQRAALDDLAGAATVEFTGQDGKPRQGSRLEMLRAALALRAPHSLTVGKVPGEVAYSLPAAPPEPKPGEADRSAADAVLGATDVGRAILAARRGSKNGH
jgi:hypothetical protein